MVTAEPAARADPAAAADSGATVARVPFLGARLAGVLHSPSVLGGVVVVLVAAAARVACLDYGLPLLTHPDEPTNVTIGQTMVDHGDWNPRNFGYPSMLFEVNAAASWVHGLVTGRHTTGIRMQSEGSGITTEPSLFLALRGVSALLSVGMCLLVYLTVRRVSGHIVPTTLAGLGLALSPVAVASGVMIAPDAYAGFFTALTLAGALAVARRGRLPDYLLAGASAGLAAAAKYNAGMVALAVVAAHLVRHGPRCWRQPAILASAAAALAAFVLIVPAAVFDLHNLVSGVLFQVHYYATGHSGAQGASAWYYLHALGRDPLLVTGAALSLALLPGRYRRETLVVLPYSAAYALLISAQAVHFARNLLPLLPALAILTGLTADAAAERIRRLPSRATILTVTTAAALVAASGLALPATATAGLPRLLDEHPRTEAANWLAANIPPRSRLLVEWYAPYLPPGAYQLTKVNFAVGVAQPPAGVAAVVVTERGSGRFLSQPDRYPRQITAYQRLRTRYCPTARWTDGPWIEILTPCPI